MQCYTIVSQSDLNLTEKNNEAANAILASGQERMQENRRLLAFKNKVDAVDMARQLGKGTTLYILELDVNAKRQPDYSTFYLKNKNGKGITITDFTKISGDFALAPPKKKPKSLFSRVKSGLLYAGGLATGILYRDQARASMQCQVDIKTLSQQQIQSLYTRNNTFVLNDILKCTITNDSIFPDISSYMSLDRLPQNPWVLYGGAAAISLSALALCALSYRAYIAPSSKVNNYTRQLNTESKQLNRLRQQLQTDPKGRFDELLREFAALKDQATHRFDQSDSRSHFNPDALFVTSWERRMLTNVRDAHHSSKRTLANSLVEEAKTIREISALFSRSL